MFTKAIGLFLYCITLGIWVIALFWLLTLSILVILPASAVIFVAGDTLNILGRTAEWPEFRYHSIHRWIRDCYFQFEISSLNPKAKVFVDNRGVGKDGKTAIWAVYPHGHFSLTHMFFFALNRNFDQLKPAAHSLLFYLPVVGSLMGWIGATSVNEPDLRNTLRSGKSVLMCPGGIADSVNTGNIVTKRRGFLRVAYETGAVVIPVWSFAERTYYAQWLPLGFTLQRWLVLPVPMFVWGEFWFPILPRRPIKSRIAIGRPIDFRFTESGERLSLEEGETQFWKELVALQSSC